MGSRATLASGIGLLVTSTPPQRSRSGSRWCSSQWYVCALQAPKRGDVPVERTGAALRATVPLQQDQRGVVGRSGLAHHLEQVTVQAAQHFGGGQLLGQVAHE